MTVSAAQRSALQEVIHTIITATGAPRKRAIAEEFLELVDREEWPHYYEVIPEPRCLNSIQANIEKNRYKDAMDAYTDISLVFWNALYYNEEGSQIAVDANTLKGILQTEWKKRPVLPPFLRMSPPPSAPQKVHNSVPQASPEASSSAMPTPPPPSTTKIQTKTLRPRAAKHFTSAAQVDSDLDMDSDDVDIDGSSPEPDARPVVVKPVEPAAEVERDTEIVSALERGLPLWPGFGQDGWIENDQLFSADRIIDIVHIIKTHKDVIGNRMALFLEAVPEDTSVPGSACPHPISLKIIEGRARSKSYTAKEFDLEMAYLFQKARRWHEATSEAYGKVLLLQRFYQALTSSTPPVGPPYVSQTNFAALPIGPGNAKPLIETGTAPPTIITSSSNTVAGITTYRIPTRDRTFVDEVVYKGWSIRCADWVHLSNSDDPSRPIVAQVWKCWVSDEPSKKGEFGMTVCWYYRPEQTFHTADKRFWEGEVFKTSHFADHPLADLLEKITVQFTARHIRGRARPPYYYPFFPLYVCDQRYNDRERSFVKIKNWNSCVPEEVRKSEIFMPIYLFERTVWPKAQESPFLKSSSGAGGVKFPGGLVEGSSAEAEKALRAGDTRAADIIPAASTGSTTRSMTAAAAAAYPYGNLPYNQQLMSAAYGLGTRVPLVVQQDRSIIGAAGVLAGGAHIEKLPAETAKFFDRDPETNEVLWFSAPPEINMARNPEPKYSLKYLNFLAEKRKREEEGIDVDQVEDKRRRFTVMEAMSALLVGVSKDN